MEMSLVGKVITLAFVQMISSDISVPTWSDFSNVSSVDSVHTADLTDWEWEAPDQSLHHRLIPLILRLLMSKGIGEEGGQNGE